ncbi:MAG TPA: hypothetical protein VGD69_28535 [Herpetosiphonaceae bacterium]
MSEQYLIDIEGNTVGIVIDPATYKELVRAREELDRIRAAHAAGAPSVDAGDKQHSIRELRGLGKEIWAGIDAQQYIREERDSWDG